MALQSSGAISISQIKTELSSSSNSLRTLSSLAGKSTPDAMSEFYGYSAVTYIAIFTEIFGDFGQLCAGGPGEGITVYSASHAQLVVGDTLYSDSAGALYNGGNNYHKNMNSGNGCRVRIDGRVGPEDICD